MMCIELFRKSTNSFCVLHFCIFSFLWYSVETLPVGCTRDETENVLADAEPKLDSEFLNLFSRVGLDDKMVAEIKYVEGRLSKIK